MKRNNYSHCILNVVFMGLFLSKIQAQDAVTDNASGIRNVIVIVGDDHASHAIGAYGNKVIRTPNLDRLASEGSLFKSAYANSPVCTPSRQSFLTGKLPHATGVTLLQTALSDSTYTIAEHLKKFGFATAAVGKTHFNSQLKHGFDYVVRRDAYHTFRDTIRQKLPENIKYRNTKNPWTDGVRIWWNVDGLPDSSFDQYSEGTFVANQANDFIEKHKNERFCLWVGFWEPHSPFNFPLEYKDRYRPEDMPLAMGTKEDDRFEPLVFKDLTNDERKGIIRSYYTSIEYLDKNVGLILDSLQKLGIEEETLVIYLGDNGYLLNHHKRFEKHTMWEESAKVPLIIRVGKKSEGGVPRVVNNLVELVDLAPTILEVLGVEQMPGLHGQSLTPLLKGEHVKHRDYIFSEYLIDKMAMVRDKKYKYVFMNTDKDLQIGYETGKGPIGLYQALYDLEADPHETTNLINKTQYQSIVERLRTEMLRRFRTTHPLANQVPDNISVVDQLSQFVIPREESK